MTAETHFVQGADGPVLVATGPETLNCTCGNTLIQGFDPLRFLAIGIQCKRCGTVTTTEPLPDTELPPRTAVIAAPSTVPRMTGMQIPPGASVVGQAESARLQALFQPATSDGTYLVSAALLDEAEAAFERITGATLPAMEPASQQPFDGLRDHPLAWAIRRLRDRIASGTWACMEDAPTANAVTLVTGFLHFAGTWSRHPFFPAMVATAAERGFSLQGLAPFAAGHCLTMIGNRIRFPKPTGYPGRIDDFELVTGSDTVGVHTDVFDRFEFPFGRPWDPAGLRAAVSDVLEAAQGRINLRNPGLLVLSPGAALGGFDEALIEAIKTSMQVAGRKNRGLIAAAAVVLRVQALPDPHATRFGYGFFPILNRHYRGEAAAGLAS